MHDNEIYRFETARFAVVAYAEPEEMTPSDSFCDADDIEFASTGDPAHWFCAVVKVLDKETGAVLGRDTLGGCSYNSFDEFVTRHRSADPMDRNCSIMRAARGHNVCIGHYFPDMIAEAITSARNTIKRIAL